MTFKIMTLYRGVNKTEKESLENFENLNNISWWSSSIKTAQTFMVDFVVKIKIRLNYSEENDFVRGKFGQTKEYKNFGKIKKEECFWFSIHKDYLKNNILEVEYIPAEKCIPNLFLNSPEIDLEKFPFIWIKRLNKDGSSTSVESKDKKEDLTNAFSCKKPIITNDELIIVFEV